jgi:hypothetical protein
MVTRIQHDSEKSNRHAAPGSVSTSGATGRGGEGMGEEGKREVRYQRSVGRIRRESVSRLVGEAGKRQKVKRVHSSRFTVAETESLKNSKFEARNSKPR